MDLCISVYQSIHKLNSIGVTMFGNEFCLFLFHLILQKEMKCALFISPHSKTTYLLIGYDGDPNFMDHVRPPGLQENGCIHHADLFACTDDRFAKGIFFCSGKATNNSNRRQLDASPSSPAWLILVFTRRAISGHTMSVRSFRRSCNTQTHRLANTHFCYTSSSTP